MSTFEMSAEPFCTEIRRDMGSLMDENWGLLGLKGEVTGTFGQQDK